MGTFTLSGRTGLRVSPLSLGAGTFGEKWGDSWSMTEATMDAIIGRYLDAGGNLIDSANVYQDGQSEEWIGGWLKRSGRRNDTLLATKFGFENGFGGPFAGGNSRTTILRELDASLARLGTDHIDLYYLHVWDTLTPPEEVMAVFDTIVRQGKARYVGVSNVPGWWLGRAQTLSEGFGRTPLAALQANYSLLARATENEYVDAVQALGMGLHAWSPLQNGLLSGKYTVDEEGNLGGTGRITESWKTDRSLDLKAPHVRETLKVLREVADEAGRPPAQVALRWVMQRPGVVSTIIGGRTEQQIAENLGALDFTLAPEHTARLDAASAPPPVYPYTFFGDPQQASGVRAGHEITAEPSTYRGRGARR